MRMPAGILVLVLVQGVAGCDSHSAVLPTVPTSTSLPGASPAPGAVGQERWNLTGTYIGHTGPIACIPPFDGVPRNPFDSVLLIQRSDESIHLFTDHNHYVGTVVADELFATESDDSGATWQCGEARLHYRTEGHVSGRFSADGRVLTGEEVALYRLDSGETIRRHWIWSATRQ
jgi:hypothetical protein